MSRTIGSSANERVSHASQSLSTPNGRPDAAMARTCGDAFKSRAFRGSLRVVTEWATRRRRAEKADAENLQRIPSARTIARMMTIGRHTLSKAETITIAAIENGVPPLVEAREIIAAFQAMVRNKVDAELASFAGGVAKDEAAVRAAITLPWSNGQTEGHITKLKLVKRQMYGRGKIDLLQARLIGAI
jgi:transposase